MVVTGAGLFNVGLDQEALLDDLRTEVVDLLDDLSRSFMYAGELGNQVVEQVLMRGTVSATSLLKSLLRRGSDRHQRPSIGDPTLLPYLCGIRHIADVMEPDSTGSIGQHGDGASHEITWGCNDVRYTARAAVLLEYSGFIDPLGTHLDLDYRFYPPGTQAVFRCVLTDESVDVDSGCVESMTFRPIKSAADYVESLVSDWRS